MSDGLRDNKPFIGDLCRFHDLGIDFADCTCQDNGTSKQADLLRKNAELTASNARLREQMADVLVQSTNWMNKFDARQEAIRLAELNNTQLCQAAKGILNSTPYHLTSCRYLDTFGVKPCNCPLGSARGHMEKIIVQSPAASLAAIQDAARVEERERCLTILRKRLEEALIYSTAKAIRHIIYNIEEPCGNRGNGGKAQSI